MKVLIDSDVILDVFLKRTPFFSSSATIISYGERNKISLCTTPLIISNVYYLLRKNFEHKKIIENLQILLEFTDILTMGKPAVILALNSEFSDFEDALENYTAENSGDVDFIITRNIKDYKNSKLKVLSPDKFIELINNNA